MKLFKKIAQLFQSIATVFTGNVPKELREYADLSLKITYGIKRFMEGSTADLLTAIIPGDIDETVRKQILSHINKVLPYMLIINDCKDKGDTGEMLKCWAENLKTLPEDVRNALLMKLASRLTSEQDQNQLKQSIYDYATQGQYTAIVKNENFQAKHADAISAEPEETKKNKK